MSARACPKRRREVGAGTTVVLMAGHGSPAAECATPWVGDRGQGTGHLDEVARAAWLAYFATHPQRVTALFGRYLDPMTDAPAAATPVAA